MTFRLSPCIWCKWSVDICRMSWFFSPQDQGPIETPGADLSRSVSSRGLPRMDDRSWEAAMSLAERASLHTVSQMHLVCWQSTEVFWDDLVLSFSSKFLVTFKTATAVKRFLTDDRGDGTGDEGRTTFSTEIDWDFMASPGEALSKASTFQDPVGSPFLDRFAVLWKHHQFCRGWCRLVF